ncbi:MAG TPA: 8-oxoguanine deaminase [Thermotogota bacterium]|nr:8-oxoguanine deaminase [Thermotogota bacterium]HRW91888.1 8-oxoguanine deaminase [Thermotogota bacterium]
MRKILKNIAYLATFDGKGSEWTDAFVVVEGNRIEALGSGEIPSNWLDSSPQIIDCSGMLVIPGLVNTHHHLFQSLFRNVPGAQDARLFEWLIFLYEKWKFMDPEAIAISAKTGLLEMMKTGVTTSSDMFYLFPRGDSSLFDVYIEAARQTGMRFHPTRGSMSLGKKNGGLPPDSVVQSEDEILRASEEAIQKYHDASDLSMLRIALAPCSPFSVSPALMQQSLALAEKHNVLLHTHLAETKDEEAYCLERYGLRPVDFMDSLGWLNPRVWFAHCVWLTPQDISKFATAGVGVSHCPASNMRLGSGIAPIVEMLSHPSIRISLAVDGSASNDGGNMVQEARQALLLQRVAKGADCISARQVLRMATMGGAQVLRRETEIGSLEPGKAADIVAFDLNRIEFAGGLSDPLAALLFCDAPDSSMVMVNGEILRAEGEFLHQDIPGLVAQHNRISLSLAL